MRVERAAIMRGTSGTLAGHASTGRNHLLQAILDKLEDGPKIFAGRR
jgi:hypothetical protein